LNHAEKRSELRAAYVNLVEIDLTHSGKRILGLHPGHVPPAYRTTYQVCGWRARRPLAFEVYRAPLRERLPAIKVPLREKDADVPLDLQALIDQCYANGRYDDLDHKVDPDPPLDREDAAWADELLRAKGAR
jgi:hypothetical protein